MDKAVDAHVDVAGCGCGLDWVDFVTRFANGRWSRGYQHGGGCGRMWLERAGCIDTYELGIWWAWWVVSGEW